MTVRIPFIEPGIIPIFRLYLSIQLIVLSLALLSTAGQRQSPPDLLAGFGWWEAVILLIYLAWPGLRRWLGRRFLPLALIFATLWPIIGFFVSEGWKMHLGAVGTTAQVDPSLFYLWLLLPLLLVSAQFRLPALFCYSGGSLVLISGGALVFAAQHGPPPGPTIAAAIGLFIIYSIAGVVIIRLSQAQREYREQLAHQQAQLARYAIIQEQLAITRERNRLARDLHDTLAHTLSAVSVQLNALDAVWESDAAAARVLLHQTYDLTRVGLDDARRALRDLRADPLTELGLVFALRRLADQAAQRAGLQLHTHVPDHFPALPPEAEMQIYRIAEETLNNIVRHANARHLWVTVARQPTLVLTIADDGRGFDLATPLTGHFGLVGMYERAQVIGATLAIESRAGQGTRMTLSLPTQGGRL